MRRRRVSGCRPMVMLRELYNCVEVYGNKGRVMSYVLRVAAAYVVLVGAAVAVHFIITPFYHSAGTPFTAWHYVNWFIAPALLVTLGASYAGKRRMESGGSAEIKRYLEANAVFYGTVAASIIYFWNWFLVLTPANAADHQFFSVLGAALPILMVVVGLRLWDMSRGATGGCGWPLKGHRCLGRMPRHSGGNGDETGKSRFGSDFLRLEDIKDGIRDHALKTGEDTSMVRCRTNPAVTVFMMLIIVAVFASCSPAFGSGRDVEHSRVVNELEDPSTKTTIVFADYNWPSAQIQNRIAQYVVEEGLGYPTDVIFGSTLPLLQGLRHGDVDVSMEIWESNQNDAWLKALEAEEVVPLGLSLGSDWQSAFVIPAYLQHQFPDLDSVEDLKEQKYKDVFKTAETGDRVRLVSCVIGWACEVVNAAQIEAYGLGDHIYVVHPGDGAALNADLYGAYEKKEPWLGYQWGTNGPALKLDLVRLKEPAYSDECWSTTKACAYKDATILVAVNAGLPAKAPDVVEFLREWDFSIDTYKEVVRWREENPDADTDDAAIWWLNSNTKVWSSWVPDAAVASIRAALAEGETPDGWPDE